MLLAKKSSLSIVSVSRMDVEILEFNIPSAKNTLLLLKNIETELKKDDLYLKLYEMFSAYGLLFQVFFI